MNKIKALTQSEYATIETEVMQLQEWSGDCPARCPAAATRKNYIKLFYAYTAQTEKLKLFCERILGQNER
jgi:hypothetical protein